MKKILLLLALAATTTAAHAQDGGTKKDLYTSVGGTTSSRNTGFGVKGGYNYNNIRGADISGLNRDSHSDFHVGIYGQFGFNKFSSIQAELLYSRQGFGANTGTGGTSQTYHTNYLMLPILYVGNITETISFHIGPQVSLLTQATKGDDDLKLDSNGFNSFDYGGAAGVEARVGPARVGARYNLSLGKIFKDNIPTGAAVSSAFANSNIYNNLFQVYVGIGFAQ
jgi:hypothetical protein